MCVWTYLWTLLLSFGVRVRVGLDAPGADPARCCRLLVRAGSRGGGLGLFERELDLRLLGWGGGRAGGGNLLSGIGRA